MQSAERIKSSDHGIKAQGDGWLLTVALIEGSNIAAVDSNGLSNPYVVFTCNGKTRTSSIKFNKSDPLWNEIFEFDAMDDPPSVLDVVVYAFDGPFDEAASLGHSEINFLKTNISDLADLCVSLEGKLAQACHTKLHLKIFLDNTRGGNVVKHYISKMEREVGKKINLRSPQTNSAFHKHFGLPPEEFLINDFTCHLKRKMPLQVHLLCYVILKVVNIIDKGFNQSKLPCSEFSGYFFIISTTVYFVLLFNLSLLIYYSFSSFFLLLKIVAAIVLLL